MILPVLFGEWEDLLTHMNELPEETQNALHRAIERVAEEYVKMVKLALVQSGKIVPDSADFTAVRDSAVLSLIKVTRHLASEHGENFRYSDVSAIFAGIDKDVLIDSISVVDMLTRKEYGIYGPRGTGIWRLSLRKLVNDVAPRILDEELQKVRF